MHESYAPIVIRPYAHPDWRALWQIRAAYLAEDGIQVDKLPDQPDLTSPYEVDLHRIDETYLRAKGNFWIAWVGATPAGYVGAQDMGKGIELRRMYVQPSFRRHGVGGRLVHCLIEHCTAHGVKIIELWTAYDGLGRHLYAKFGFRPTAQRGPEFSMAPIRDGEMRIRLNLDAGKQ
jgi:GNAT superfamily N-acetyltransferase